MIQTIKNHPPQALSTLLLIIPFFGKFNNYFHLFLKSCEYNPSINWLIITDDDTPYNYPSNVKVRYMSFAELRQKIQSNFDFPISLPHPYKLCDYKPAYGYIFAEELKGFDFWGHCDNDLIFGDIRAFLTPDIFLKYDKILCKGHLSIFRNNEQMNSFFMVNSNNAYKAVFETPFNVAFDEWGPVGILNVFNRLLSPESFWKSSCFDDPNALLHYFLPVGKESEQKTNIIYRFSYGKLMKLHTTTDGLHQTINEEEVLYTHLQKRPMSVNTDCDNEFLIVPNRFIPNINNLSLDTLYKLAGYKLFYRQAVKLRLKSIFKRFNLVKYYKYKSTILKIHGLLNAK